VLTKNAYRRLSSAKGYRFEPATTKASSELLIQSVITRAHSSGSITQALASELTLRYASDAYFEITALVGDKYILVSDYN
jgi:hypothetical protein